MKARRIAQLFRRSAQLSSALRSDLKVRNSALTNIILCVETRWCSLFFMLERMQKIMDSINTVLECTNHNVYLLTPDELKDLEDIIKLLSPFADIVNDMNEQNYYYSISLIIPFTKCLLLKVQQTEVNSVQCRKLKEKLESEIKERLASYESMLICR